MMRQMYHLQVLEGSDEQHGSIGQATFHLFAVVHRQEYISTTVVE
jgi:hypothetical protein